MIKLNCPYCGAKLNRTHHEDNVIEYYCSDNYWHHCLWVNNHHCFKYRFCFIHNNNNYGYYSEENKNISLWRNSTHILDHNKHYEIDLNNHQESFNHIKQLLLNLLLFT